MGRRSHAIGWLGAVLLCAPLAATAPDGGPPPAAGGSGGDPHELLVRFAPHATTGIQAATHRAYGAYRERRGRRGDWEVVVLPPYVDRAEALRHYADDPHVEHVEPNRTVRRAAIRAATVEPDDERFDEQWGLARMRLPEAWAEMDEPGDAGGIVVAILDTGIERNHEDLHGNIWSNPDPADCNDVEDGDPCADTWGWDFVNGDNDPEDDEGHGTHVAGIAGAVGNNGIGVAGTVWNVELMAVKVLDSGGTGNLADIIDGVGYAVDSGADIVNLSLEWRVSLDDGPLPTGCDGFKSDGLLLCEEIERVGDEGVLVTAAAGNAGDSNETGSISLPASYPLSNLLSIAASVEVDDAGEPADGLASFSNYGLRTVHLAAPGQAILSTDLSGADGGGYSHESGTSMAAPAAAGLLALLLAEDDDPGGPLRHLHARERLLGTVACDAEGDGDPRPCAAAPLGGGGEELNATTLAGGRADALAALTTAEGDIPPVAPSHFGVALESDIARLTWLPSRPTATGYEIERRLPEDDEFEGIGSVADPETGSFEDTGLDDIPEEGVIAYRIRAVDGGRHSRWTIAHLAPDLPPPAGLAAAVSGFTVHLSWDPYPISPDLVEFELRRRPENRAERIITVDGDATAYDDTVPDPDRYAYDLRACLNGSCSGWSEAVEVDVFGKGGAVMADHFQGFEEAGSDLRCFIATAAYGAAWEDEVRALRAFRDDFLMPYRAGRAVVAAYYAVSPPLARWIAADERRRAAARALLTPLVRLVGAKLIASEAKQ